MDQESQQTAGRFGEWLKREREAVGMTQADLARSAGLSLSAVRGYEQATRLPGLVQAVRLADALDADFGELAAAVRQPAKSRKRPASG